MKNKNIIKEVLKEIGIWLFRKLYTNVVIMGGTLTKEKDMELDEKHGAEVYGLDNLCLVSGEVHTFREMFAVLFEEHGDFVDEIIIPAMRLAAKKSRVTIPMDTVNKMRNSDIKTKRTVN